MYKPLVAVGALLVSCLVGNAQEKPPVHVVIQAAPEQIKKAAMAMFARNGYSLDSDAALQLRISKPFSEEETAAYNTAHWTNPPVANCRHVQAFLLSPADEGTHVTTTREMVCGKDGRVRRLFGSDGDQKEIAVGAKRSGRSESED